MRGGNLFDLFFLLFPVGSKVPEQSSLFWFEPAHSPPRRGSNGFPPRTNAYMYLPLTRLCLYLRLCCCTFTSSVYISPFPSIFLSFFTLPIIFFSSSVSYFPRYSINLNHVGEQRGGGEWSRLLVPYQRSIYFRFT
jgi:hypothetical protein